MPRSAYGWDTSASAANLVTLNALLRGGTGADFSLIVGDTSTLQSVRYVITLDTDTQLPRDAAKMLIASIAHPLNRPHYDTQRRCIDAGYGILQPRVAASLPSTRRSLYARLHAGDAGIDPYTRAISDVYQDAFGEGSFIGKGHLRCRRVRIRAEGTPAGKPHPESRSAGRLLRALRPAQRCRIVRRLSVELHL